MLERVDPWFIAFVVLAAIGAGAAVRLTRQRRADAAERDRLESAIERSTARAASERADRELLLDTLATGILTLDARLRIVAANPAAHELLGRASGQLLGLSVMEAFLDSGAESIARVALDDGHAAGELQLTNADGPTLIVQARRSVDDGLWLVLQDVSELRRLQRIRAEFIDNLSHELRTPLTTVSLLAETLAREAEGQGSRVPAKMRERIAKIEVETGHLVQMVSELLDLSRIESGGTLQLVDGLDLGRLAAESIERLRLFAERQGVTLRVTADANIPPVRGDGARLGQVVINLVHNAVKFSPDGGDVTVHVRAAPGEVITSVQDHGVGVPRAAQDRVFERFYKVDRARLRAGAGGGTGLGLAIARHVVEQHGGRIWLESVEGRGSTFSFAIPVPVDGMG
jgi:two-component system phosphate regulon sensor histidine kinase PhoR